MIFFKKKLFTNNIYFSHIFSESFFALAWGVSLSHSVFQLLAVGGTNNKVYFISTNDLRVEVTQDIANLGKGKARKVRSLNAGINSLSFHPTQLDILICRYSIKIYKLAKFVTKKLDFQVECYQKNTKCCSLNFPTTTYRT